MSLTLALALAVAPPLPSFEFGGLRASELIAADRPELTRCVGPPAKLSCNLTRPSFADVPILYSNVVMHDGLLYGLFIGGDANLYSQAVEALKVKYGKPDSTDLVPTTPGGQQFTRAATWRFADGFLNIQKTDGERQFLLVFGSNRKTAPVVDF